MSWGLIRSLPFCRHVCIAFKILNNIAAQFTVDCFSLLGGLWLSGRAFESVAVSLTRVQAFAWARVMLTLVVPLSEHSFMFSGFKS